MNLDSIIRYIQKFADARSFTFPYAKTKEDILTALGIRSIPATYIINAKGDIVKKYIGARGWTEEEILTEIRMAVKQKMQSESEN